MKPNIVFLDIDGVLNSSAWFQHRGDEGVDWSHKQIDPRAVALLNELAPRETTRIVVSSTWRLAGKANVRRELESAGVEAFVFDVTPDFPDDNRAAEIAAWLAEHGARFAEFVIIDDDYTAGVGNAPRFVNTDHAVGLTAANVERAKAILAGNRAAGG